jgi:hypothetical protein
MRFLVLAFSLSIAAFGVLLPTKSTASGEVDRAEICPKSTNPSQCRSEQPIRLADRLGEPGACVIKVSQVETPTICKLVINADKIAVYSEIGDRLESLKGQKASQEILIPPNLVKTIRYNYGTKDNSTARILNALSFGPLGGLLTRDKKVAEIAIDYITPLTGSLAFKSTTTLPEKEISPSSREPKLMTVVTVVRRKTGETLRQQLERSTGLVAEVPLPPVRR